MKRIALALAGLLTALTLVATSPASADTYVPTNPDDGITATDFPYPDDAHVYSCDQARTLAECAQVVKDMQWALEFNHGLFGLARYTLAQTQTDLAASEAKVQRQAERLAAKDVTIAAKDATIARLRERLAALQSRR